MMKICEDKLCSQKVLEFDEVLDDLDDTTKENLDDTTEDDLDAFTEEDLDDSTEDDLNASTEDNLDDSSEDDLENLADKPKEGYEGYNEGDGLDDVDMALEKRNTSE